MTVSITSIKSEAKSTLKGNFVVAMISALTILFSFLIIDNLAWVLGNVFGDMVANFIVLLFGILFCGPLTVGVIRAFWRMYNKQVETPAVVFYYFSKPILYYKAIRLCFMIAVRVLFFAALFYLPAIIVYVISSPQIYDFLKMPIPIWSQHLAQIIRFLSTFGAVLTVFSVFKYYLAPMLVIVDNEIDAEEAIHMSAVISKTSLFDFIFLIFTLFFWILISLFFVPLIFTLPYLLMCYVVHAAYSIKDYNEKIKKLNDENLPSFVAGI